MATICVDLDGVVVDLVTPWLRRYNQDWGDNLGYCDITDWHTHQFVKPECGTRVYDYIEDPTIYDEAEPVPLALEGIGYLRNRGHRIVFNTTSTLGTVGRKFYWLVEHGFLSIKDRKDYVETADKSLLKGDLLIDDGLHNIDAFQGKGVVLTQPWNMGRKVDFRADDWDDFITKFFAGVYIHPTEARNPLQAVSFRDFIEKMYKVHLDKNADYSPANILGAGEQGLVTREWDKVARLMNLTGFDVQVDEYTFETEMVGKIWNKYIPIMHNFGHKPKFSNISFVGPKDGKNESLDDNLVDFAVYAVIWKLYREGVWGK